MSRIFIFIFLFSVTTCVAQKKIPSGVRKGLLRAEGSLAYGSGENSRYFLQGELEYLVHNRVGINSESYISIGPFGIYPGGYHTIFSGPAFHFPMSKQLDFALAAQPGLSFVSTQKTGDLPAISEIIPNSSVMAMMAYYGSFFHVFFQMRANAAYINDIEKRQNLSDMRLSFGLGWNLNFRVK